MPDVIQLDNLGARLLIAHPTITRPTALIDTIIITALVPNIFITTRIPNAILRTVIMPCSAVPEYLRTDPLNVLFCRATFII